MNDGSILFIIVLSVFLILLGSSGIHTLKNPNSPIFNFMIIVLIGGILCLGVGAILTLMSLLTSL